MSAFSGHLRLNAARRAHGRTVLAGQSFRAPFHVGKPYWDADAGVLHVQVVNPTAGILAGDRLESHVTAGAGAALLLSTPSASRVFRMRNGSAESMQVFTVKSGGWLEVLPEPLVPHGGCRFRQHTSIEVEPGAAAFVADQLMPGRMAHGEAWAWERLVVEVEVTSGGVPLLRERLDQSGPELQRLARLAGFNSGACFANAVMIAGDPSDMGWLEQVRAMHGGGIWVGISRLRGAGWSIRIIAPSGIGLRRALARLRSILSVPWPRMGCSLRRPSP